MEKVELTYNFQIWVVDLLSLNESLQTTDIVSLLGEYLSELQNYRTVPIYDTIYRKLKKLVKDGVLVQDKGDHMSWWSLVPRESVVEDWSYYIKYMKENNHVLLNSISEKDGGTGKGSGFGWAFRKFLELMKEVHNND